MGFADAMANSIEEQDRDWDEAGLSSQLPSNKYPELDLEELVDRVRDIKKKYEYSHVCKNTEVLRISVNLQYIDSDVRNLICKELRRFENIKKIMEIGFQ